MKRMSFQYFPFDISKNFVLNESLVMIKLMSKFLKKMFVSYSFKETDPKSISQFWTLFCIKKDFNFNVNHLTLNSRLNLK
jgi:hypothetical protein